MENKLLSIIHFILSFWQLRPMLWCICSVSSLLLFTFGFLFNHFLIGTISFLIMLILLIIQCTDNGFFGEM